jgi:hypothetical protein
MPPPELDDEATVELEAIVLELTLAALDDDAEAEALEALALEALLEEALVPVALVEVPVALVVPVATLVPLPLVAPASLALASAVVAVLAASFVELAVEAPEVPPAPLSSTRLSSPKDEPLPARAHATTSPNASASLRISPSFESTAPAASFA